MSRELERTKLDNEAAGSSSSPEAETIESREELGEDCLGSLSLR